jgi:hypothetical protein
MSTQMLPFSAPLLPTALTFSYKAPIFISFTIVSIAFFGTDSFYPFLALLVLALLFPTPLL